MNMFARFDENPAMTLQDIKETKRYGRTDGWTDRRTHGRTHTRTTWKQYTHHKQSLRGYNKVFVLHIWTCLQGLMKIQQWLFKILRKQSVTDGRTDARTHGSTHGQRENSIPTTNKVCGGIVIWGQRLSLLRGLNVHDIEMALSFINIAKIYCQKVAFRF